MEKKLRKGHRRFHFESKPADTTESIDAILDYFNNLAISDISDAILDDFDNLAISDISDTILDYFNNLAISNISDAIWVISIT